MGRLNVQKPQWGMTMIEVLVSVILLSVGLLGLAALQARMQQAELESYQRVQALILVNDMAQRMAANRYDAANYVTGTSTPLGTGMTCPTTTTTTQQRDTGEWCNALQGSTELSGTANVGAVIGARGCVESLNADTYMVTVAWQGAGPLAAPPNSVACGANQYDSAGTPCVNDRCRRVVTSIVRLATL